MGATTINGVNNAGDLVGFYTDSAGNTDGFLAKAVRTVTVHLNLSAMPTGSVLVSSPGDGVKQLTIAAYGLTPGSSHTVQLHGSPIGTLTADSTGQAWTTLTVNGYPSDARVKILDAGDGSTLIAQTSPLGSGNGSHALHADGLHRRRQWQHQPRDPDGHERDHPAAVHRLVPQPSPGRHEKHPVQRHADD
jgi:hypothetical protein